MKKNLIIGIMLCLGWSFADAATAAKRTTAPAVSLAEFDNVDPHHEIPDEPLRQALTYFKANRKAFPNQSYLVIADFSESANSRRLHLLNLKTGEVQNLLTSHGSGSDPRATGIAHTFGKKESSHKTSLGIYRTGEVYNGKHGTSLRLDGLSPTNDNARARDIVIHAAWYVSEAQRHAGRSWGCLAVDPKELQGLVSKVKKGAMVYAWRGQ